jgi:hypothetical protein
MKRTISSKLALTFFVFLTLFITGCPSQQDNLYPIASEQYNLGWVLHNVDDSTPSYVTYSENELAVYNYSYGFPGQSPQKFDNIVFWADPMQNGAAASHIRFGAPHNRVNYIRWNPVTDPEIYEGNFEWNFQTTTYINHVVRDDDLEQFAYEVSTGEAYHGEGYDNRWIVKPLPGNYGDVTIGVPPYLPTYLTANESFLILGSPLLSSQNRNSYIRRETELSACGDGCVYIRLPKPTIKLYKDSSLLFEQNLTTDPSNQGLWDYTSLKYNLLEGGAGNYIASIEIPLDYPVFNDTKINTSFYYDGITNPNLPVLDHIDFKPRFNLNESIFVNASTDDSNDAVKLYYQTDVEPNWILIQNNEVVINDESVNSMSFKIEITSDSANISYEIYPISLKARDVNCWYNWADYNIEENLTKIHANCGDNYGNSVRGLKISLFEDDVIIGNAITDINGKIEFDISGQHNGVITLFFEGTGIYNPMTNGTRAKCIDSDNGIYPYRKSDYVSGIIDGKYFEGNESCETLEDGTEYVDEYYCNNWNPTDTYLYNADLRCYHGCSGGACVKNSTILIEEDIAPLEFYNVYFAEDYCVFGYPGCDTWVADYRNNNQSLIIDAYVEIKDHIINESEFNASLFAFIDEVNGRGSTKSLNLFAQNKLLKNLAASSEPVLSFEPIVYMGQKLYLVSYSGQFQFLIWFKDDKTILVLDEASYETTETNISFYAVVDAYLDRYPSQLSNGELSCTDSDGGLNYYVRGYGLGNNTPAGPVFDSCLDITRLDELMCVGKQIAHTTYNCPLGCLNGSCNYGCGDGIKNFNESCDGTDFGSLTCGSYGHNSGSLSCMQNCTINSSACYTTTTPVSGSSGGGGGSGRSTQGQTFVVGDITASMPLTTGRGDTITFYYKGIKHKIEINKVNSNDVEIIVSSTPQKATITLGQTKMFDIDGDGDNDLRIILEKISSKKAYLNIDLVRTSVSAPICNNNGLCELGETRNNCPNDCEVEDSVIVTPQGQQPVYVQKVICNYNEICDSDETPNSCPSDCKRSYKDSIILGIIALAALSLIIFFFVYEAKQHTLYMIPKKTKNEIMHFLKLNKSLSEIRSYMIFKKFSDKEIEEAMNYSHNFKLLQRYVTKCVEWGYTRSEIKRVLRNARWPKNIAEDVLEAFVK